jgi:hypothetical protein
MRQAEGDLSHVISGWLIDSGGTRGNWIEDASPAGLARAGCAGISPRVGGSKATGPGGICERHRVRAQLCPLAAQP